MKTNKKTLRKIAGAATAAVLATCAIAPISVTNVSAANQITITNSQPGHNYKAYQVFDGDLDANGKLSKITWGIGVNGDALATAIQSISDGTKTPFNGLTEAADIAEALAAYSDASYPDLSNAVVTAFADAVALNLKESGAKSLTAGANDKYTVSIADDEAGYYFIKDDTIDTNATNMSYTRYIVKVVGDVTVAAKTGLPELEKKVMDINDSDTTDTTNNKYMDSADYDIGNAVPFKLTATVAEDFEAYTTYKFIINDTLSDGLTFNKSSLKVYVGTSETPLSSGYTINTKADGTVTTGETFEVVFNDLQSIDGVTNGTKITVTYNATLNENAVIGSVGNPNTANLEYSNNPNETNGSTMGHTPDDKVIVFTYETDILKVDDKNAALAGAKFSLYKYNATSTADDKWEIVKTIDDTTSENITTFKFTGLDDGYYKLVEDQAPEGFNTLKDPKYFKITASHTEKSDTPVLGELSATALSFDTDSGTFSTSNITEPIQLTAKDFETPADTDTIKDYLEGTIQNKAGSELPSTGGIGTTPFYVGGGVLVAAAGVYIIVKKRMKNNDEEK